MHKYVKKFLQCESGAVTVDWVVLTAAIVGMALGVVAQLNNGTTNVSSNISNSIANQTVGD